MRALALAKVFHFASSNTPAQIPIPRQGDSSKALEELHWRRVRQFRRV
jgi:hypothetical protein